MRVKYVIGFVLLVILAFCFGTTGFTQKSQTNSLFINLTSNETNRAAMAIFFAQKTLSDRSVPVTIFLNVEGVFLAHKDKPQNLYADGKTPREMLEEFIQKGGKVLACPMCMKNVGHMTAEDLIEGVSEADPQLWDILFSEGARVVSY